MISLSVRWLCRAKGKHWIERVSAAVLLSVPEEVHESSVVAWSHGEIVEELDPDRVLSFSTLNLDIAESLCTVCGAGNIEDIWRTEALWSSDRISIVL